MAPWTGLGFVRLSKGSEERAADAPPPQKKEKPQKKGLDIRGRLGKLRGGKADNDAVKASSKEPRASRLPAFGRVTSYVGGVVSALSANLRIWRNKDR